jgi:hypothetical protein
MQNDLIYGYGGSKKRDTMMYRILQKYQEFFLHNLALQNLAS